MIQLFSIQFNSFSTIRVCMHVEPGTHRDEKIWLNSIQRKKKVYLDELGNVH